jgi:transcription termination factor NusB
VIAEAVRLAKTYSTDKSGAFVNGVLASLARSGR